VNEFESLGAGSAVIDRAYNYRLGSTVGAVYDRAPRPTISNLFTANGKIAVQCERI